MIIGIDLNKYFADTEFRTGCERSARGLMITTFGRDG